MMERREIQIVGGTAALCFWLFAIFMTLMDISVQFGEALKKLDNGIKIVIVEPNEIKTEK